MLKLFTKKDRSTFPYYFSHVLAFNLVAILLRRWKPKYIFHDWEKPWLMLLWKDYGRVQKWHRGHRRHHLEYPNPEKIDWEALAIDLECSRLTKEASPLTARGEYEKVKDTKFKEIWMRHKFELTLMELGLWDEERAENLLKLNIKDLPNE